MVHHKQQPRHLRALARRAGLPRHYIPRAMRPLSTASTALLHATRRMIHKDQAQLARENEELRARLAIGLSHPMVCESWESGECKLDRSALDDIPDRADATALVMIGSWDTCMEKSENDRLEPELRNLVAPMGPEAVWSQAVHSASAVIRVPCRVVRHFLRTNNVWWYLPAWRDYPSAQLWVVLSDSDDQPADAQDFSVHIHHRHRPASDFSPGFCSGERCPQCWRV